MKPINFIVTNLFQESGAEIARWAGVTRESVNRWLRDERRPPLEILRPIFRAKAAERGLPWNDAWLFELPVCDACIGPDNCVSGCRRVSDRCMGHDLHDGVLPPAHNGNHAAEIPQETHEALP